MIVSFFSVAADIPQITIGRRGENNVKQIVFDYSAWAELLGTGDLRLWFRTPGSALAREIALRIEGHTAAWLVSAEDTAVSGQGEAQLFYSLPGGRLKKGNRFAVVILPNIYG